jgi:hypothetical protein
LHVEYERIVALILGALPGLPVAGVALLNLGYGLVRRRRV